MNNKLQRKTGEAPEKLKIINPSANTVNSIERRNQNLGIQSERNVEQKVVNNEGMEREEMRRSELSNGC